mmetsp:Transcript_9263/g.20473  ORF Transcript_9263/g.20473 Transcript_9263/m.20473 type:complete len:299 (+) Transcript_9263:456-1352(+)
MATMSTSKGDMACSWNPGRGTEKLERPGAEARPRPAGASGIFWKSENSRFGTPWDLPKGMFGSSGAQGSGLGVGGVVPHLLVENLQGFGSQTLLCVGSQFGLHSIDTVQATVLLRSPAGLLRLEALFASSVDAVDTEKAASEQDADEEERPVLAPHFVFPVGAKHILHRFLDWRNGFGGSQTHSCVALLERQQHLCIAPSEILGVVLLPAGLVDLLIQVHVVFFLDVMPQSQEDRVPSADEVPRVPLELGSQSGLPGELRSTFWVNPGGLDVLGGLVEEGGQGSSNKLPGVTASVLIL